MLQPHATPPSAIRNFFIIAHIDHGKSTLADRMLQITGIVDDRAMRAQYLDRMDIERERGITIKSQAVRMPWAVTGESGATDAYILNMIDTPGHVDFTYEVSRSLQACEAAVLLVDAAQGIEAQTLANLYLALGADLHIIPVLNKIDLPGAEPEKYAAELAHVIGCDPEDVLKVSAKTGVGVEELLNEQQTEIRFCPVCQIRVNVSIRDDAVFYRCVRCQGPLVTPQAAAQLDVVEDSVIVVSREPLPLEVRLAYHIPDRRLGKYIVVKELGVGGAG